MLVVQGYPSRYQLAAPHRHGQGYRAVLLLSAVVAVTASRSSIMHPSYVLSLTLLLFLATMLLPHSTTIPGHHAPPSTSSPLCIATVLHHASFLHPQPLPTTVPGHHALRSSRYQLSAVKCHGPPSCIVPTSSASPYYCSWPPCSSFIPLPALRCASVRSKMSSVTHPPM
ncbi:hypothetical protein J6590_034558 [Homalodisca vitripennis]|nr:hypothetical protein J6590_034558 [Homalodisca vitripennis]